MQQAFTLSQTHAKQLDLLVRLGSPGAHLEMKIPEQEMY